MKQGIVPAKLVGCVGSQYLSGYISSLCTACLLLLACCVVDIAGKEIVELLLDECTVCAQRVKCPAPRSWCSTHPIGLLIHTYERTLLQM